MGADVAEAAGRAGLLRICAPARLLLPALFEARAQPTLDVAGTNGVDFAQFAGLHHGPRLPDQRVAGVVVRQRENDARLLDRLGQLLGLLQVKSHRLVANDVEPGLGEGFGDLEVRVIRRGHRDEIDLVGTLRFRGDHFLVGAIGTLGRNVVIGCRGLGLFGIGR